MNLVQTCQHIFLFVSQLEDPEHVTAGFECGYVQYQTLTQTQLLRKFQEFYSNLQKAEASDYTARQIPQRPKCWQSQMVLNALKTLTKIIIQGYHLPCRRFTALSASSACLNTRKAKPGGFLKHKYMCMVSFLKLSEILIFALNTLNLHCCIFLFRCLKGYCCSLFQSVQYFIFSFCMLDIYRIHRQIVMHVASIMWCYDFLYGQNHH